MGYQSRARTAKKAKREYRKTFQEKSKTTKRSNKSVKQSWDQKETYSQQQVFERTLKRLHILGNQKFGSSPFWEHFKRWLLTVETVLDEFEAQLDIEVDEQFLEERKQVLTAIKLQLEEHHQREENLERKIYALSDTKGRLQQVNKEYLTKTLTLRRQKTNTLRQINKEVEELRKEQDQIVKLKTGFFRGISKKERETKEALAVQRYMNKQQEFEVTVLKFKEKQKQLEEEFKNTQEPLLEEVKNFQKYTKEMEEDHSLEDRWFTCETLKDNINNFFQRKKIPT